MEGDIEEKKLKFQVTFTLIRLCETLTIHAITLKKVIKTFFKILPEIFLVILTGECSIGGGGGL